MTVDVIIEDARWADLKLEQLAQVAVVQTLDYLNLKGFEATLLGCDDARISGLNADFRGKPAATNVLSWPSDERAPEQDGATPLIPDPTDPELGDIAISYDTCAAEARAADRPMADHVTHLVVHGVLHLLGYDHERDADATLMEGIETQILGKLGLPDPYRD